MKFKIGDRVFVRHWDLRNEREDRGLGHIKREVNSGTSSKLYVVEFDKPLHGSMFNDNDYYDTDIFLYDDKNKRNCPKCYERMEFKFLILEVNGEQKIYQCAYCKNIESI